MRKRHLESCIPHSDKIWVNNGKTSKRIYEKDLHIYKDFVRGRLITNPTEFGNYDKTGKNNPFYGKSHSAETKLKISEAKKGTKPHNYGKKMKWVTDNTVEKQIDFSNDIPEGWSRGRLKRGLN